MRINRHSFVTFSLLVMVMFSLSLIAQSNGKMNADRSDLGRAYLVQLKEGYSASMVRNELIHNCFRVAFFEKDFMVIQVRSQSRVDGMIKGLKFASFMTSDQRIAKSHPGIQKSVMRQFLDLKHHEYKVVAKMSQAPIGSFIRKPGKKNSVVNYLEETIRKKKLDQLHMEWGWKKSDNNKGKATLQISSPMTITEDEYEENDDMGSAAEVTPGTYTDLACLDDDWYGVDVAEGQDLVVSINYPHADGDLVLELYDSSGTLISYTSHWSDHEIVRRKDLLNDMYYVRVYGRSGATNVYSMDIQTGDLLGNISGRVTNSGGIDLYDVSVSLYDSSGNWLGMLFDANTGFHDGNYTLGDVPAGSYKVQFGDVAYEWGPGYYGVYLGEWYDDKPDSDSADPVVVTADSTTSDIDAVLAFSGQISGRVTDEGGSGVAYVDVYVYDLDNNYVSYALTDENGDYIAGGLKTGTYKAKFCPSGSSLLDEWYNNKADFDSADGIDVTISETTSDVDVVLSPAGFISGNVTDSGGSGIQWVDVFIYNLSEELVDTTWTDASGDYTSSGLPAGSYKVRFSSNDNYLTEWYDDQADFSGAGAVAVTGGSTTSGIDAVLADGGTITGRVTDAAGNGISLPDGIFVFDLDYNEVGHGDAGADGYYSVDGLPTGTYKVQFIPIENPGYVGEWYNDKLTFTAADGAAVTAGSTTSGIDATLASPAGYISGRVTDSEGNGLWKDAFVLAYFANDSDHFVSVTGVGENGDYLLGNLPTGTYKVRFVPEDTSGQYMEEWYDDKSLFALADPVIVTIGSTTSGIDAVMTSGGPVDGLTITAPNGSEDWEVGSGQSITWTSTGSIVNVKIEYSTDNGSSWADVVATTTNDGTYEWAVPDSPSSQCLVRVSDAADSLPTDASDSTFTIAAPVDVPEISLNRSQLNFGVESGTQTQSQDVLVSNAGEGTLNWSVSDDAAWLGVSPASGSGTAKLTVSVDATGLNVGTYNGTVTVSDAAATNSPQTVAVTLNVYAADGAEAPFGAFATPVDQSTVQSSISVSGWALDDVEVVSVKIYREAGENLVFIGDAVFVEGARPDLETSYPSYPLNYRGGWGYMLLTYGLPDQGMSATYTLHAIATDKEGNTTDLGNKTITCDNQHAVKPFGAIATPTQGGEASGEAFRNWGWALTPPPNMIPVDGSTLWVLVDGVPVGQPVYNIYRTDVAALFPDCLNSDGAGAYFDLDTREGNGVHTIAWVATDNAGNADGIGSRFFKIVNTSSYRAATIGGVQAILNADTIKDYLIENVPVRLSRNGNDPRRGREIQVDPLNGTIKIEMNVLSAIALDLNPDQKPSVSFTGYMRVRNELRKLPIGSTMDTKNNLFYWQPAPGFYGEYELVFVDKNHKLVKRIYVIVK